MDMVVMGESRRITDFADSTSKLESKVQINSIAIDISSSMEAIEAPVHEHFSIRGFVAGMRKRDWKTCFPFASAGNDVDAVDYLPPLVVPEFRWWQCSSCIPNDEMKTTTEEMVAATKGDVNISSCEDVGGNDGSFIHKRGSKGKTDMRDIEAGNSCGKTGVNSQQAMERLICTPDATDMVCLADRPFCVVEEPDNASSGNDDTISVLPRRRKLKLRSLADIMVEERNQTSSSSRTISASSCGMQVASTAETEAVLVPQLEANIPAVVAKAARSPERKRKIDLGEDREPLVATSLRAVLDAEKNSRRVEISDPESKGVASMRLDLPGNQRSKPKRAKGIDANKKMRQIGRDGEIAQMREYLQPNINVSSANLQEQVVPMETNLGKFEEMGLRIRRSLSGQQMEKISDRSMTKIPEVGADDEPLLPSRKSILEKCNTRGTVAWDLSLNSFMDAEENHNDRASLRERRCSIPDLNVAYPEKTAMTEEQESTILSEKRSLPLQKTLDGFASCSDETVREGKRISELKNKDCNVDFGPSDGIPMEIVELLAKNQLERALGNSRRHLLGINDTAKGYSAIDVDGCPGTSNFPLPSRINGFKVANGNMGLKPNKCQMHMSKPEKIHFGLLSSSAPSQLRKPEYPTSASIMAEPSSTTWEELLYSCARETAHFRLSISQNRPIQPNAHSFLDECHKERTVIDMKDYKGKKAAADVAELKGGRIRSNYTPIGSLDPYSNDTIPAMQLLSLMDPRVKSGTSYDVGTKSSLDMPFSTTCKHHPHLNGKENVHSFLREPFFPQNSSSKDFSLLRYGVYSAVQAPQEVKNTKTTLLEGSSDLERRAARSNAALGDCALNRNPADFSIPEVGNEFTISANDLRPRMMNALKEKSRAGEDVDGRKRQRVRKST